MTVASEITRLQWAKSDIRQAIIDKWVNVWANLTLDEYAACIAAIKSWPKWYVDILLVWWWWGGGCCWNMNMWWWWGWWEVSEAFWYPVNWWFQVYVWNWWSSCEDDYWNTGCPWWCSYITDISWWCSLLSAKWGCGWNSCRWGDSGNWYKWWASGGNYQWWSGAGAGGDWNTWTYYSAPWWIWKIATFDNCCYSCWGWWGGCRQAWSNWPYCWGWWGGGRANSGVWWIVKIRYLVSSWITATWWTVTTCNWCKTHTFTSNWTFTIVS